MLSHFEEERARLKAQQPSLQPLYPLPAQKQISAAWPQQDVYMASAASTPQPLAQPHGPSMPAASAAAQQPQQHQGAGHIGIQVNQPMLPISSSGNASATFNSPPPPPHQHSALQPAGLMSAQHPAAPPTYQQQ